ncbi:hypothetical protein ISS07_00965 [Candidatus Woesearchaeota archaeon]|nr:hypothetical protein [Candidatus Woesearchaeota archaeon]
MMNDYDMAQLSEMYNTLIATKNSFLIKVGTNVLTDANKEIDVLRIDDIANQAARLHKQDKKVVIVSSGAIGIGKSVSPDYTVHMEETLGMDQGLAAIGQARLMSHYCEQLEKHGIAGAQMLLTYDQLRNKERLENFKKAVNWTYQLGGLPILNENDVVATEEIEQKNGMRFGDNDQLSVMAAIPLGIEVIIMLTEKDGFLREGNGEKFHVVDNPNYMWDHVSEEKSSMGKGGPKSKLKATKEALENGMYVIHLGGKQESGIDRMLSGEPLGTLFLPKNFK